MREKGITLIEIIVSCILIAITLIGIVNLFVSGKRYVLHSRSRMAGGEIGKVFLDPLQMQVRQDTWDQAANSLQIPPAQESRSWSGAPLNIGGISYAPNYTVSRLRAPLTGNDTGLRKLKINVTWSEPQP